MVSITHGYTTSLSALCLVTIVMLPPQPSLGQNVIQIGVMFREERSSLEGAVRLAIDMINKDSAVLPGHTLNYTAVITGSGPSRFHIMHKVCELIKSGTAAVIGLMTSMATKTTQPFCRGFHVPLIAPTATDPTLSSSHFTPYLLRLSPPDSRQSEALADLIHHFNWDSLAILTDDTGYGINGMAELQKLAAQRKWRVASVQQFVHTTNYSLVDASDQLDNIKGQGVRVVVLNCLAEHAEYVLEQAADKGMMQSGWTWLLTDGVTASNIFPERLGENSYLRGVIGTRPAASDGALYEDFKKRWSSADPDVYYTAGNSSSTETSGRTLAYYDAVVVLANALHQMLEVNRHQTSTVNHGTRHQMSTVNHGNCLQYPAEYMEKGHLLFDYLKQVSTDGVTKYLDFSKDGSPSDAAYTYVTLKDSTGWESFGRWTQLDGPSDMASDSLRVLEDTPVFDIKAYVGDLLNKTLKVVTILDPPFVMKKGPPANDSEELPCSGNNCYHGYCIDMLDKLAEYLEFDYELYEVADGKYGSYNPVTGRWNGMVADLIVDDFGETRADISVASMTISYDRQRAIDFTKPYRDLQLGILLGTPDGISYDPWSFLSPLSYDMWGLTIASALVVGVAISLLDKLSPYGHHGRKAHIEHEHEHEAMDMNDDGTVDYWEMKEWRDEKHAMSLTTALLWSFASLFEQGGERHPKSWSARIAAGTWWVGTLIIVQSYTANLAAFLTIKASDAGINSVEDLAAQSEVRFGTVDNTQIQMFFRNAQRAPYVGLAERMEDWQAYFPSSEEAIQHTIDMNGTFAFLYDLPILEYWRGQNCRLTTVENGFWSFGYGLGLPKQSPYTEELTIAIYQLRESGYMDSLDRKWITKTSRCEKDVSGDISQETVEIGVPSLSGVFWIIYVGMAVSMGILVLEWIISAMAAINRDGNNSPRTFGESLKQRFGVLKRDVMQNWFAVNFNREEEKRKQRVVMPVPGDLTMLARFSTAFTNLHAKAKKDSSTTPANDADKMAAATSKQPP